MAPPRKTVFLHVGCRKSGTSALQLGLSEAGAALVEHGVELPLEGRGPIRRRLVEPLQRAVEGDVAAGRRALDRLAGTIRRSRAPRAVITLEALAEMPAEATRLVAEGLAEFDTRVVVTARPWALTVPSEWQQLVKSRFTGEYLDFIEALRNPTEGPLGAEAARFRRRQDLRDVVARWRAGDAELPVHVLLVPHSRDVRPDIVTLFCDLVDLDPQLLPQPERIVNPSLTHEDAEVVRQVNLALGDRLQDLRGDYRDGVRNYIAVRAMMRASSGSRIRLPREAEAWAAAESGAQLDEVIAMGCDVRGDESAFRNPSLPGEDFTPATDTDVARAATSALAELAVIRAKEKQKARRKQKKGGSGASA